MHIFFTFTVPSGIPLHFTVEMALARSVFLSWDPPMVQDRNGIIRGYEIELSSNVQEHLQTFSVDSRNETLLINGTFIKPFKRYFCRIAAFTAVGTGPLSELITVQTLEDGKVYFSLLLYLYPLYPLIVLH